MAVHDRKRDLLLRVSLGSIIPALILLAWWYGIKVGTAVVPTFGEVVDVLRHPFRPPDIYSGSLAFSFYMTILRLSVGFGLAVVTAVPLGVLAGRFRTVRYLINPAVQMSRPINPIVLLPIATVLFGITSVASVLYGALDAWRHDVFDQVQIAMILILWWGGFFPILLSTIHGVYSVRKTYIETMQILGADWWQTFRHVYLPYTLPHIINGMRIAMGVTWLVLIAAEIFPGTRSGLGYMLCTACKTSDYQYTFAALIVIGVTGFILDSGLHLMEKKTGHWLSSVR
ncbi:MAG: ABC transporter permease [Nitrospirae bacterium]|nr:MAG: ABC transporter permease [Nitrospirota bacterium]